MRKIKLLLLLMLLPMVGSAYDFEVDGIYYNIVDGEASVTFKEGTYSANSCWSDYSGIIVIPETITYNNITYQVTSIGEGAFWHCSDVTSVIIPNTVKHIGNLAFRECTKLTDFSIPNSVISIGQYAFYNCYNLTNINLPNTVAMVEHSAFDGTAWYDNQQDGLVYIGSVLYKYKGIMPEQTTIYVRDGTLGIGGGAFSNYNNLTNVIIPNSVEHIGGFAFYGCNGITSINIPNSVKTIYPQAFCNCSNLADVNLGNGVSYIGLMAFCYCRSLVKICIPSSVKFIGLDAFYKNNSSGISMEVTLCGNIDSVDNHIFNTISSLFIAREVTYIPNLRIQPDRIYSFAKTPPVCQESTFTSYNSELHVPASSFAAYFTAPIWENFNNIIGNAVDVQTINLSQDNLVLSLGEQTTLTASLLPANAYPNEILWSTSDPTIASVNNGRISALAIGECDIIASNLNKQAICHVIVKDASIELSLDQHEACVLPNHIISLTVNSSSDIMPELAVSSSDPSVAAARVVNNKIQVVGIKEGTTTITVGSVDGTAIPATCLVTVYTEPGDLDCDGFLSISDVTSLIDYLLSGDNSQISTKNADVNGDESINISDVTELIDILLSGNGN